MHALAACSNGASETIARAVESLLKLGREAIEHPEPAATLNEFHGLALQMIKGLLANLRVGRRNGLVELHTEGLGSLAEFGTLLEAEFDEGSDAEPGQETIERSDPAGIYVSQWIAREGMSRTTRRIRNDRRVVRFRPK